METVAFISPHYDDAALFCGMKIQDHLRRGDEVSVITVFGQGASDVTGLTPLACYLHKRWGILNPQELTLQRKAEDIAALTKLGLGLDNIIWLNFIESIYRISEGYRDMPLELYWHEDFSLYDKVYCPLGTSHIDHDLCYSFCLHTEHDGIVFYDDTFDYPEGFQFRKPENFIWLEEIFEWKLFWKKYLAMRQYKTQVKDLYEHKSLFLSLMKPEVFYR